MWWVFALLSAIFAALVALFGKIGLKNVDPSLSTTIRASVMAVFLVLNTFLIRHYPLKSLSQISQRDYIYIVLSDLAGAASWLFYFIALKYGIASKVSAIDRTSLLFIIVLSALFLGESLTWKALLGGVLIIGGTLLITLK